MLCCLASSAFRFASTVVWTADSIKYNRQSKFGVTYLYFELWCDEWGVDLTETHTRWCLTLQIAIEKSCNSCNCTKVLISQDELILECVQGQRNLRCDYSLGTKSLIYESNCQLWPEIRGWYLNALCPGQRRDLRFSNTSVGVWVSEVRLSPLICP